MSRYTPPEEKTVMLTQEETIIIKSCLDKSFWSHSVPCAIAAFAGVKFASTRGFKPGVLTHLFSVLGATVMGRLFAIPKCMNEAAGKVPDGEIAKRLRGHGGRREYDEFIPPSIEPEVPEQKSVMLDDSSDKPTTQSKQTYDDLRRRNREEYLSNQNKKLASSIQESPNSGTSQSTLDPFPSAPYYSDPASSYSDPPSPYSESSPSVPALSDDELKPRRRKRINKYGDEIEE